MHYLEAKLWLVIALQMCLKRSPKSSIRVYGAFSLVAVHGAHHLRVTSRLHISVWIDSGHGIQRDQVPEAWLLQD